MADVDYLNMSDEEWLNAAPPTAQEQAPVADANDELPDPTDEATEGDAQSTGGETDAEAVAAEGEPTGEPEGTDADAEGDAQTKDETEPKATEEVTVDFEAAYKRLTAPFKANGREIQVKDVDDAIALMQMGANYNKKMAALRPHLKLMKLLESNGLMSEEQIGFLIDVQRKDPAALSKLIKDSGVDPMELDTSKADDYRPTVRTVDDREIELDQVLQDIQHSPTYSKTLNVVSQQWDGASKQVIANQPQLLQVINSHMENGIYDLIQTELENERMYGRLTGLSDIEAYRKVGDAIQARGGFNHIRPSVNTVPARTPPVSKKPSQEQIQKTNERKRSASTSTAAPTQQAKDFNPLAMSDEEFAKLATARYS